MARLALGLEDRRHVLREGDLLRRIGGQCLCRDRHRGSKCDEPRPETPAPAHCTTLHERLLAHSQYLLNEPLPPLAATQIWLEQFTAVSCDGASALCGIFAG